MWKQGVVVCLSVTTLGINFSDLITVVFYSERPFTFIFPSANSSQNSSKTDRTFRHRIIGNGPNRLQR